MTKIPDEKCLLSMIDSILLDDYFSDSYFNIYSLFVCDCVPLLDINYIPEAPIRPLIKILLFCASNFVFLFLSLM